MIKKLLIIGGLLAVCVGAYLVVLSRPARERLSFQILLQAPPGADVYVGLDKLPVTAGGKAEIEVRTQDLKQYPKASLDQVLHAIAREHEARLEKHDLITQPVHNRFRIHEGHIILELGMGFYDCIYLVLLEDSVLETWHTIALRIRQPGLCVMVGPRRRVAPKIVSTWLDDGFFRVKRVALTLEVSPRIRAQSDYLKYVRNIDPGWWILQFPIGTQRLSHEPAQARRGR